MTKDDHGRSQAAAQLRSIKEMVAALDVDFERLQKLLDERKDLDSALDRAMGDDVALIQTDIDNWMLENSDELAELSAAAGDCNDYDDAQQRVYEDALDITLTGRWSAGSDPEADGFEILLCTGGPAVKIVGTLGNGEPDTAWLMYQDWGTPWTRYISDEYDESDEKALLRYAQTHNPCGV